MPKRMLTLAAMAIALAACPATANAMHISEGILPGNWAALWFLAAAPFLAWGLYVIRRRAAADPKYLPTVAMVGAAIFVISCMPIPVPFAGTCSHPCGVALGVILIGPAATIVVATIALVIQAMFLAHGGLTTLGGNIVSMGVVGSLSAWAVYRLLLTVRAPMAVAAFAAGLIGDWATYATTAAELSAGLCDPGGFVGLFALIALAFVPTQVPLGLLEGMLTAGACRFVAARRPELLDGVAPQAAPAVAKEDA